MIYELYDGAPILSKQIEVENQGKSSIVLNSFKSEILALTETAPKVHYGEPHEIRMLAQEPVLTLVIIGNLLHRLTRLVNI